MIFIDGKNAAVSSNQYTETDFEVGLNFCVFMHEETPAPPSAVWPMGFWFSKSDQILN